MKLNLKNRQERINQVLDKYLPAPDLEPKRLHQAMRYSVLNGGKRIRPLLVYATGEIFGADLDSLDIPACAIELVHAYSLIHDDLPAMDNDGVRRGKPSCHKAFDEATAILAGDALFNLAFQILAENNLAQTMIPVLAKACSSFGMAGGQAIDLESIGKQMSLAQLENMHNLKTGALIRASVKLGAIAANCNQQQLGILDNYAKCLGLAFQIQDDILDANEINDNKVTYVSLLGLEQAKIKLEESHKKAKRYLESLAIDNNLLYFLSDVIAATAAY
jgi:geranylgeranyl pyrophosphate synthase